MKLETAVAAVPDYTPLPTVVLVKTMKGMAKFCPDCGRRSVVPLTLKQLESQPDSTMYVCHPAIGGCNLGYGPRLLEETFEVH